MSVLLLLLLLTVSACGIVAAPALYRLFQGSAACEITPEWLEHFSASNYTPMLGVLSQDDFRFVARQPGFDLRLYRNFRRQRLQTYRAYLRSLVIDFNRLQKLASLAIASSESDHSELASRLIVLRLRFSVSIIQAECTCLLWYFGLPTVLAHRAISMLDELAFEVQRFTPVVAVRA